MPSLRYEEIEVSDELLSDLKADFDKAPPEKKIGRWYAMNHYSRLRRYRSQGFHLNYLSGADARHCTCGLVIHEGRGEPAVEVSLPKGSSVRLDAVQSYKGHRNLLGESEFSVALVIDHKFSWELREDLFEGLCQGCGLATGFIRWKLVAEFCREHDANCQEAVM